MVLWKKESNCADALYVDLLKSPGDPFYETFLRMTKLINKKNDQTSIRLRGSGNEKFQEKSWLEAMDFYNKSLQFATVGSEQISLAYANRSTCFLHIEKYDKCLADIELAKKANYPERLMPKLIEREAKCLKLMVKSTQSKTIEKPTLSFESDEKFPCMANVLQICSNDKFGRHIVAKADIEVGQIVVTEEAFVFDAKRCGPKSELFTACSTCLNFAMNFIPCPNCSDAIFCDAKCMESNDVHKFGCGAAYHSIPDAKVFVEPILKAVAAFPNIDELMTFVEKSLASRDFGPLDGVSDAKRKYGAILKLLGGQNLSDLSNVWKTYKLTLDIPGMKSRFDSLQKQRFLMHLILQHIRNVDRNIFAFGLSDEKSIVILGIVSSFFNHACYNNTTVEICGNQLIAYAVRPIKKGEQLFIRYKSNEFLVENEMEHTTDERRAIVRDMFKFECNCSKCVPRYKKIDRVRMQSDPNFQFFTSEQLVNNMIETGNVSSLKDKFRNFLTKYGRLPWCYEIQMAQTGFDSIMLIDINEAFNFYERCIELP